MSGKLLREIFKKHLTLSLFIRNFIDKKKEVIMKVKEVLQSLVLFGLMYLALVMAFIMDVTQ